MRAGICPGVTAAGGEQTPAAQPDPNPSCRRKSLLIDNAYLHWLAASEQENHMINVTFPDGARREFPEGISGLDIAKGISPSLAKRTVAMALDGTLADLAS